MSFSLATIEQQDAFGVPGATWTRTELTLPDDLDYDEWEPLGWALGRLRDMSAWALGDWLNYGEAAYGEAYAQAVEATGRSKTTILEYGRVARKVARDRRHPDLPWTAHQVVAALQPDEQIEWLERAAANKWSVEELRGMLAADPPLLTRRDQFKIPHNELAAVHEIVRALFRAAEPIGNGFVRVPEEVLDRLATALGEDRHDQPGDVITQTGAAVA